MTPLKFYNTNSWRVLPGKATDSWIEISSAQVFGICTQDEKVNKFYDFSMTSSSLSSVLLLSSSVLSAASVLLSASLQEIKLRLKNCLFLLPKNFDSFSMKKIEIRSASASFLQFLKFSPIFEVFLSDNLKTCCPSNDLTPAYRHTVASCLIEKLLRGV